MGAMTPQQDGAQEHKSNDNQYYFNVVSMTKWRQGHRRGFSFLPGEDSVNSKSPHTQIDPGSDGQVSIPSTGCQDGNSGCDDVKRTMQDILVPSLPSSSQQATRSAMAPAVQAVMPNSRGDDSSKGVLTALGGSSGQTPMSSRRPSVSSGMETSILRGTCKLSENHHFAIAAARAARNSETSRDAVATGA